MAANTLDTTVDSAAPGPPLSAARAARWLNAQSNHVILRYPLVPASLGLIAGIITDRYYPAPLWAHATAFILAGIMLWAAWRVAQQGALLAVMAIVLAAGATGALRHQVTFWRVSPQHLLLDVDEQGGLLRLRGTVLTEPVSSEPAQGPYSRPMPAQQRTTFILRAEEKRASTEWSPCDGLVRMSVLAENIGVQAGDHIETFTRLRRIAGPGNPGEFDWQRYQRRSGIYLSALVEEAESLATIQPATLTSSPLSSLLTRFRQRCRAVLLDSIDPEAPESGLLAGYVSGYRWSVSKQLDEAFRRSGTIHILAVSGSHVIMIGAIAAGAAMLVFRRPKRAVLAGLAAVIFFTLLVEPNPPALRAAVMAIIGSAAFLLNRPANPMNALAASLLILLLFGPAALFMAGFQLSFVAVIALFLVCPTVDRWLFGPRILAEVVRERMRRHSESSPYPAIWRCVHPTLCTSITAWIASTPLIAYHYGTLYTYGALATLLILPIATITLAIGFAKLLLGLLTPTGNAWLAPLATWSAGWMARLAEWCGSWPATCPPVPAPPVWLIAVFYALLLTWAWVDRRQQRQIAALLDDAPDSPVVAAARLPAQRRIADRMHEAILRGVRPLPSWVIALAAGASLGGYWLAAWIAATPPDSPRVHVLAIGDGLAVLVRSPAGKTLLYDCGSSTLADVAQSVLVPALHHLNVRRIDTVVLSHPNIDHYNGLPGLADKIAVGQVLIGKAFAESQGPAGRLVQEIRDRHIPVRQVARGQILDALAPLSVKVLWPGQDEPAGTSDNDSSLVLRIEHAGRSVLLTGDIGPDVQDRLATDCPDEIQADILVLPHHGRGKTLSKDFLDAASPAVAVASVADPSLAVHVNPDEYCTYRLYDTPTSGMVTVDLQPDAVAVAEFRHRH